MEYFNTYFVNILTVESGDFLVFRQDLCLDYLCEYFDLKGYYYWAYDEIVKISMMANTVEDSNHDPNLYSEIDVSSCTP